MYLFIVSIMRQLAYLISKITFKLRDRKFLRRLNMLEFFMDFKWDIKRLSLSCSILIPIAQIHFMQTVYSPN